MVFVCQYEDRILFSHILTRPGRSIDMKIFPSENLSIHKSSWISNRYVLGLVNHKMNLNKDIVDKPLHILEAIN